MTPNQSKTSCDQEPISHWLPDRPTNMLWSGALIRAHCHPDQQHESLIDQRTFYSRELLPELTQSLRGQQHRFPIGNSYQSSLTPRSTNKHVMIGSSYQSSLTPRSTRWSGLIDPLTNHLFLRSGAVIRAHCHPDQQIHWISDWPTKRFALFLDSLVDRQTSHDQELLSELIDTQSIKNVLRSGALIRAHWLPDRPTNMLWSGALIRAHWHPDRQDDQGSLTPWSIKNFLRSGALIRARWFPDHLTNFLLLGALIRAYSLPDWSESPCDQELVLELSDSRIDQQFSSDREL